MACIASADSYPEELHRFPSSTVNGDIISDKQPQSGRFERTSCRGRHPSLRHVKNSTQVLRQRSTGRAIQDVVPDNTFGARERRQFTVANVGNNAKIYDRLGESHHLTCLVLQRLFVEARPIANQRPPALQHGVSHDTATTSILNPESRFQSSNEQRAPGRPATLARIHIISARISTALPNCLDVDHRRADRQGQQETAKAITPQIKQSQDPRKPPTPDPSPVSLPVQPSGRKPSASQAFSISTQNLSAHRHVPFVMAYESALVAQQFTVIERDALNKIKWQDLIDMVLTQNVEERAMAIITYIHIAKYWRKHQNYATLLQLTIALSSIDISRLEKTWELIPASEKRTLRN
ncbi:MAG: hypothetical protein L6R42_000341 [Xanthoria sp. 1 TBL-2021]|nr:MAG: hypothetical protein L6R42_000341 [Xanthoria sp. 1 TBL-2021]